MFKRHCKRLHGKAGIALLESIIASVVVTVLIVFVSLTAPRMLKGLTIRKQQAVATTIAQSQIQQFQVSHYFTVPLTPATQFVGGGCDCSTNVDWDLVPMTPVVNGQSFFLSQVCVNYTDTAGAIHTCPSTGDTGFKKVIARVSWGEGPDQRDRIVNAQISSKVLILAYPVAGANPATINGTLTSSEAGGVPLSNLNVELANNLGEVVGSTRTENNGQYTFGELLAGTYAVSPVLQGNWTSIPLYQTFTLIADEVRSNVDFTLTGVQANIPVSGEPETFVLIMRSGTTPSGTAPPEMSRTDSSSFIPYTQTAYMGVIGDEGTLVLSVPAGATYEITCWTPDATTGSYSRGSTEDIPGTDVNFAPQTDPGTVMACP